jgi:hypothetical protein
MVAHLNSAACPMLVVKVGSSLLVEQGGAVRRDWLATLVVLKRADGLVLPMRKPRPLWDKFCYPGFGLNCWARRG